jgi:hypothetical protein
MCHICLNSAVNSFMGSGWNQHVFGGMTGTAFRTYGSETLVPKQFA